jgi:cbb3-type cytochrome oxidase subunit 3
MGIKGLMTWLGMNWFGVVALVVFFCCFVAIIIWVCTRPRREIDHQARIPLDEDE